LWAAGSGLEGRVVRLAWKMAFVCGALFSACRSLDFDRDEGRFCFFQPCPLRSPYPPPGEEGDASLTGPLPAAGRLAKSCQKA